MRTGCGGRLPNNGGFVLEGYWCTLGSKGGNLFISPLEVRGGDEGKNCLMAGLTSVAGFNGVRMGLFGRYV